MRLNVFFSYRHTDRDAAVLFERLQPFVESGRIGMFYDGDIGAGHVWAEKIKCSLEEADIAILALSPDYCDSPHCKHEMDHALRLARERALRVVPVILERVPLGDKLGKLQVVPDRSTRARDDWDLTLRKVGLAIEEVHTDRQRFLTRVRPERFDDLFDPPAPSVLSFEHIARAADIIERQIHGGPAFDPDVLLGVNEGGAFLAMALRRRLHKPVGAIGFKRDRGRTIDYAALPFVPASPRKAGLSLVAPRAVLVADTKLKSGDTLRSVAAFLARQYGSIEARYAVALAYNGWTPARWLIDPDRPRFPVTFRPQGVKAYVAWYTDRRSEDDDIPEVPRQ
jgi:hypoxanthine phosphoribosyltransferase